MKTKTFASVQEYKEATAALAQQVRLICRDLAAQADTKGRQALLMELQTRDPRFSSTLFDKMLDIGHQQLEASDDECLLLGIKISESQYYCS